MNGDVNGVMKGQIRTMNGMHTDFEKDCTGYDFAQWHPLDGNLQPEQISIRIIHTGEKYKTLD